MRRTILFSCMTLPVLLVGLFTKTTDVTKSSTKFYNQNIWDITKKNKNFRQELVTGSHSQVVVMSVEPHDEIGLETHDVDQTLVIVEGSGKAILNGNESPIKSGHLVFVPAGTQHNIVNTGNKALKLFTVYAPAQHKPGTVEKTNLKVQATKCFF